MSNNKQNGVARIIVIAVLTLIILMVLAWQLTKDTDKDSADTENQTTTTQPEVRTTPKTTSVDLSKWTEVSSPAPDPNEAGKFVFKDGTGKLTVFASRPIIRYSFRTPAYCAYESEKWVHYVAAGTSIEDYIKEEDSTVCSSVQPTQIAGRSGFMRHAETTGQATLTVATQQGQEWYVFEVEKNFTNTNLSEADIASARSELVAAAETLISQALN